MSDEQTTLPVSEDNGDSASAATPSPEDGGPKTFDADYVEKLRRENAHYRKLAKTHQDKATRLDELEQSQKTELQKLTEDRDNYKRRGDEAELAMARYEVALEKGLTRTQAKRLVGSTREELAADADELLVDLVAAKQKQPKPNAAQGSAEAPTGSGDWLRDQFMRS